MKKTLNFLFLVLIIIIFKGEIYAEKNEIIWLTADFPPFSIVKGPYKDKGSLSFIRKKIEKALNEYKHITMAANPKRIFYELKHQDKVIYATSAKTKMREKYALFSVPYVIVLQHHLIILKKKISLVTPYLENGEFLFDKAMEKSNLSVGFLIGRRYGKIINRIIEKHKKKKNLKPYYSNYLKDSFIDMINGSVDAIIGLPNESEYFLRVLKANETIIEYPFWGEEKYLKGYVVLPKTEWGRKTLKIVNQVLLKYRNTEEFHKNYEKWINKENRKIYRKYIKEFYNDNPLQ